MLVHDARSKLGPCLEDERPLGFPIDPANTAAIRNLTQNHEEAFHLRNRPKV
jgi:hypothetical protein